MYLEINKVLVISSSFIIIDVNKENMRPFPSTVPVTARVTTPIQSREIIISEGKICPLIYAKRIVLCMIVTIIKTYCNQM